MTQSHRSLLQMNQARDQQRSPEAASTKLEPHYDAVFPSLPAQAFPL
ncbi:hypothetical protein H6F76_26980 [Leptolyngbya sp. FACHB-321]|nr:hypothetical protein [Leptolyngbya sp. FACHB-321]MBD2038602.1 hypothetical protein [Leptolyngbya sp. FACHB-321]